jgi:hypothetical protein
VDQAERFLHRNDLVAIVGVVPCLWLVCGEDRFEDLAYATWGSLLCVAAICFDVLPTGGRPFLTGAVVFGFVFLS